jgi:DNA-binding LytR/AlgR family response regulator
MRVALCDDTNSDLENLKKLLQAYSKLNNIPLDIDIYNNSRVLINNVSYFREKEYSIYFLDIIMDKNGIDVAKELREVTPDVPIIFTTSSKEFAINAFKVQAFDYILKPVKKEELFSCLDKLITSMQVAVKASFNIKLNNLSIVTININEITYIEQKDRRLMFHMNDGTSHLTTSIRGKFLEEIPFKIEDYNFINCHSSFVINMNQIKSITDHSFIMKNGHNIPIAKRIEKQVVDTYTNYLLGE